MHRAICDHLIFLFLLRWFDDLLNWELIFVLLHIIYTEVWFIHSIWRLFCTILLFVFRKCKGINGGIKQKSSQDSRRNTTHILLIRFLFSFNVLKNDAIIHSSLTSLHFKRSLWIIRWCWILRDEILLHHGTVDVTDKIERHTIIEI